MGAGGLEKGGQFANCTGGAARYIDQFVFGTNHIYQRPTTRAIYSTTVAFDPEGILGSLTCVLCAYLGAQAGKVLLYFHANRQRILRWMLWSIMTVSIAPSHQRIDFNKSRMNLEMMSSQSLKTLVQIS